MYRRDYLKATATVAVPLALTPTDQHGIRGFRVPENAVESTQNRLEFIVKTDEDKLDSLESHVESLDNETVWHESRADYDADIATLTATPETMGVRQRDLLRNNGIAAKSYVEYIEVNKTFSYAEPIDPEGTDAWTGTSRTLQTHLRTFGDGTLEPDGVAFDGDMDVATLAEVHEHTGAMDVSGTDLSLAVIDTGVNYGSALSESRLLEASKNFITDETGTDAIADGDNHGTCVAVVLASGLENEYAGYLPEADVLGCKALDDEGTGTIDDIAAAIRHAAREGADIACMSLGSPQYSQTIEDALAYAREEGTLMIAAAGNDRQLTRWLATPASSEHTLAVGATTAEIPEDALSAYYSNIGPHNGLTDGSGGETNGRTIDVGAPGCEITAQVPQSSGSDALVTLTGTSMAAPVAGGVIGQYLASGGDDDLDALREILERTSEPIPKAAVEEVGVGMPNATNLIDGIEPDELQADAMTDEAETRGLAYHTLSQGILPRALTNVGQRTPDVI